MVCDTCWRSKLSGCSKDGTLRRILCIENESKLGTNQSLFGRMQSLCVLLAEVSVLRRHHDARQSVVCIISNDSASLGRRFVESRAMKHSSDYLIPPHVFRSKVISSTAHGARPPLHMIGSLVIVSRARHDPESVSSLQGNRKCSGNVSDLESERNRVYTCACGSRRCRDCNSSCANRFECATRARP